MKRIFIMMFTIAVCTSILTGNINSKDVDSDKKTVAIDPGHGGYDKGAQGLNGTLEKNVTLELAKMMAMELEKTYHVILTRSDDYWVDAYTRTAIANHAEADIFISIHTGGSFLHQAKKTSIYHYRQFADRDTEAENFQNTSSDDRDVQTDWIDIHKRHETTSRSLAKRMRQGLEKNDVFTGIEIKSAPLTVLEGADMPAILIELGYITNPAVEKSFRDSRVLSNIVSGIKKGIDDFSSQNRTH